MVHRSIAKIVSWNLENEAACASAARISTTEGSACEIFEAARTDPRNAALIEKVMRSGHSSVIEHAVFTIAFQDVSAFVEQYLIECRLASFTVKSRRYVDFSGLGYHVPPELEGGCLSLYREYMDGLFHGYQALLDHGIPREDARFILPYAFCSNLYCTLNARELLLLIRSVRCGRGRDVPELQDLAQQLTQQLAELFPVLLSQSGDSAAQDRDSGEGIWSASSHTIEPVQAKDTGRVRLVQSPADPAAILEMAHATARPGRSGPLDLEQLVHDPRPRELEQLSYTFLLSDVTLSCVTHLARHRMQSILIPPIQSVDHSRCIVPDTVLQAPAAKDCYLRILARAGELLERAKDHDALRRFGYYFALSGNLMDVMTTMNARESLLFVQLRACSRAQWEIRRVTERMLALLRDDFPELFRSYGPGCLLHGTCPEGRLSCGRPVRRT